MDIFFSKPFIDFFNLSVIRTENIIFPFALIDYNGIKSISSIGYQGPLCVNAVSWEENKSFISILDSFVSEHRINTHFIRYNPVLDNHIQFEDSLPSADSADFLFVRTTGQYNEYMRERPARYRNALNNTDYLELKTTLNADKSIIVNALNYRNEFFSNPAGIQSAINSGIAVLFSAMIDGKEEAASLFFTNSESAYYILNYSTDFGKKSHANLFLLNEFIIHAFKTNIKYIGLGGGISCNDSLYKFKEQFANSCSTTFHSKISGKRETINGIGFFPHYLKNVFLPDFILPPKQ